MSKRWKIKLHLSYDGSEFHGFQKQPGGKPTIQQALETGLSQLFNEPIQVVGCGRTDRGVHALNYYAHFWTNKDPSQYRLAYALNGPLTPKSIVVKNAWVAPDDFHALSSLKKTYKYAILNQLTPNPFTRNHITHVRRPLNCDHLNTLSQLIAGTHDFKSFQTSGTDVKTTIKTIHQAHWKQERDGHIVFTITGDGFLRQMVRNIVGTLIWLDLHSHPAEKLSEILSALDRQAARDTAPPEGLYLTEVEYPSELDKKCRKL